MRADLDRAADVVRLATRFDWSWTLADLDRFCELTGWTVEERGSRRVIMTTDLAIDRPESQAYVDGERVRYISIDVTDRLGKQEAATSPLPGMWFTQLCDRLRAHLYAPNQRKDGRFRELRWDLPTVVVSVCGSARDCHVLLASPSYQAEQDYIDEYIIAQRDHDLDTP
ncbi:DUF6301 family protein [Nocardia sp. NPDC046763]|uniref:DUF6301 family protein n=1 Tax=Nocardia sp. NPDC046763 TaxID=3155256 RepID=UPI0033CD5792